MTSRRTLTIVWRGGRKRSPAGRPRRSPPPRRPPPSRNGQAHGYRGEGHQPQHGSGRHSQAVCLAARRSAENDPRDQEAPCADQAPCRPAQALACLPVRDRPGWPRGLLGLRGRPRWHWLVLPVSIRLRWGRLRSVTGLLPGCLCLSAGSLPRGFLLGACLLLRGLLGGPRRAFGLALALSLSFALQPCPPSRLALLDRGDQVLALGPAGSAAGRWRCTRWPGSGRCGCARTGSERCSRRPALMCRPLGSRSGGPVPAARAAWCSLRRRTAPGERRSSQFPPPARMTPGGESGVPDHPGRRGRDGLPPARGDRMTSSLPVLEGVP